MNMCFNVDWESLSQVGFKISGLRYLFEYLYTFMSTGKVYLKLGLRFQGLDICTYAFMSTGKGCLKWDLRFQVLDISGGFLFEHLYAFMSTGKVFLKWDLRFQVLDISGGLILEHLYAFMSTGKVNLKWNLRFQGLDIYLSICVLLCRLGKLISSGI